MAQQTDRDANSGGARLRQVLETVTLVAVPSTLLTASLLYFGWVFTNARSLYFGIDPTVLRFSTQDYVVRSLDPIFGALAILLFLGLVFTWQHEVLTRWIGAGIHSRALTVAGRVMTWVGSLFAVIGFGGLLGFPGAPLLTPIALVTGIAGLKYGKYLRRKIQPVPESEATSGQSRWVPSARTALLSTVLILGTFVLLGDWANKLGKERAEALHSDLDTRPGVVIYSGHDLNLDGHGVSVKEIGQRDSAYRFQYSGLRLLARSGGNYVLLPEKWSPDNGRAILLPDDVAIRLEFSQP